MLTESYEDPDKDQTTLLRTFALVFAISEILRSIIGSENLRHFPQLIRFKSNTNRDLVTCVFPRFRQLA